MRMSDARLNFPATIARCFERLCRERTLIMIQVVSTEKGLANSVKYQLPNGGDYIRSVFIGTQDKPTTPEPNKPTLYMVQQMPGTVADAHYHVVPQWQVIVDGSGTLGRNAAKPV